VYPSKMSLLRPLLCLLVLAASGQGAPRIHGGEEASHGEFPYIISIRRIANAFQHMCAGSLVAPDWLLTSAFCVSEVGTYSIDAVGGEHNLLVPSIHEQVRGVSAIYLHPNYTHSDASVGGMATPESNDLALVKLKAPMTMTDYVKVVPLAESPTGSGECVTAGWGTHTIGGLVPGSLLQKVAAPLVGREECEARLAACQGCPALAEDGLCAGGLEGAPCFGFLWGDAGGPLVCGDLLTGVVSWGVGCGEDHLPWVNTQVSVHRGWIKEVANV